MKEEIVWAVISNTDLTEGRGRQIYRYFCRSKHTAQRLGYRRYVMGSDCPLEQVKVYFDGRRYYVPGEIVSPTKEEEALDIKDKIEEERLVRKAELIARLNLTEEEFLLLSE